MADFSREPKYRSLHQSSKFKDIAFASSSLSIFVNDMGFITSSITSSYALTASYAINAVPTTFDWRIDFASGLQVDIYPSDSCSIDSVTNVIGNPTSSILLNDSAYSFTDPIINTDKVTITVDIPSVIDLNFTL